MKIIVATPLYPPEIGRLSIYTKDLVANLKASNELTVLAYANQVESEEGVNIFTINKAQPLTIRLLKYIWSLFKLAKQTDIIYAQNAVATGLPAIIVKYFTGKPVIINFLEDEAWKRAVSSGLSKQSLNEFLEKPKLSRDIRKIINIQSWVLRRATKIIVSSKALATVVSKKYKIAEKNIIVNYTPENRSQKLEFELQKDTQQLFVKGPLLAWTGIKDIIEAVSRLKEEFKDIELIISGDGSDKVELIKLSKDLEIFDSVKFLGKISKAEDWYLLKTSQVYVHNFLDFDPDNSITQSFLAGTVVVARDNIFNREILSQAQGIMLVSEEGSEGIYRAIKKVLEDNSLSEELVSRAKVNLENNFSWIAHINRLNNLFSELIK